MKRFLVTITVVLAMFSPAMAVDPSEILDDPVLEKRARSISAGLRCLVCQNQSIDDSDADLAKDLRIVVRERLVLGDSDGEVIEFVVDRFGEFVLLKPTFAGHNLVLWLTAPILLLIGSLFTISAQRKRRKAEPVALTPEEAARLIRFLEQGDEIE